VASTVISCTRPAWVNALSVL